MRDHGDLSSATLAPADDAVLYALRRMQLDPDFRWVMVGTGLFDKLCEARAALTGEGAEDVRRLVLGNKPEGETRIEYERRRHKEEIDDLRAEYAKAGR